MLVAVVESRLLGVSYTAEGRAHHQHQPKEHQCFPQERPHRPTEIESQAIKCARSYETHSRSHAFNITARRKDARVVEGVDAQSRHPRMHA